jgi:hypothetical protein
MVRDLGLHLPRRPLAALRRRPRASARDGRWLRKRFSCSLSLTENHRDLSSLAIRWAVEWLQVQPVSRFGRQR